MKQQYLNRFIFILMALLIVFALFLQYTIVQSTDKLKAEEIKISKRYAEKIAAFITLKTQGDITSALKENPELRMQLNEVLQTFLTQKYRYIFLLQKDNKGHYRFLLDGSKDDPMDYRTIFFPQSDLFDRVYSTKRMQIIKQNKGVEQVWLSLLYPIVEKDQTKALLVLDLSESYGKHLHNFNSPLMKVTHMMQLFLFFSLLMLLFLLYRHYRFRQSILVDSVTSANTKLFLEELFNRERVDQYSTILIDIDEFKQINAKYGYASGDKIMKAFVETVRSHLKPDASIIRMAGAEFLLIVPKDETEIAPLAEKLFKALQEKRYLVGNDMAALTVSMSAMTVPEETASIQNILRLLDEKLLEIKSRGKNGLGLLGSKQLDDVKYGDMNYLKEALDEERFCCLFQPIFNTQTEEIVKFETLVRMIDRDKREKLVSPHFFMSVIKGTSQYIKMSKIVLNEVFSVLERYPDISLSVNLDLDDLYNNDMMQLITEKLSHYKEIADRLTFEILEAHEIRDYDKVAFIFGQLKAFGSKIAIDDFGSGYANYGYLMFLDIDILKIDGSLIQELKSTPDRAAVVLTSIKELAMTLGCDVVAEFVSDKEIHEKVKEIGINYTQGYYLGEAKVLEAYMGSEEHKKAADSK